MLFHLFLFFLFITFFQYLQCMFRASHKAWAQDRTSFVARDQRTRGSGRLSSDLTASTLHEKPCCAFYIVYCIVYDK